MSLRINSNDSAMNAHRNLAASSAKMGQQIERLSSGYKINRGSDDPAGLVVSENLRAQIGGLGQAISNSQNAVNMIKTAEGALTEVNSLLRSMRDLAVHAANSGANSSEAISADQAQIKSAIESLDRISQNTAFGNLKLLDGTAGQGFSINNTTKISSMSVGSNSEFVGLKGAVSVTGAVAGATQAKVDGGKAYATAATAVGAGGAGDLYINNVHIGTFAATDTAQNVIDAVNAKAGQTGVTAAYDTANTQIDLTSTSYGADATISVNQTGALIGAAAGNTSAIGTDADVTNGELTITAANGDLDTVDLSTWTAKGNTLTSAGGDVIKLVDGQSLAGADQLATLGGGSLKFQIGANAGQTAQVQIASTGTDKLGTGVDSTYSSVAKIDVTKDADTAIKVLDAAIAQVSKQRADLGAFQKNVLESNINSLGVSKENVAASESSIRDADMAAEMVEFTKYQILNQAGTAMLTQANQAPQQLLSLLR